MSQTQPPRRENALEDDHDGPTDQTIELYEEFEDQIKELSERDDTIGAIARAHKRVVEGDVDV